jgi:hypothetical protein
VDNAVLIIRHLHMEDRIGNNAVFIKHDQSKQQASESVRLVLFLQELDVGNVPDTTMKFIC